MRPAHKRTIKEACNNVPLDYDEPGDDGSVRVHAQIDGVYRCIGRVMPQASQKTLEASPGIQGWSHPRGKVSTQMFDETSVSRFADHWEKRYRSTYPFASSE